MLYLMGFGLFFCKVLLVSKIVILLYFRKAHFITEYVIQVGALNYLFSFVFLAFVSFCVPWPMYQHKERINLGRYIKYFVELEFNL